MFSRKFLSAVLISTIAACPVMAGSQDKSHKSQKHQSSSQMSSKHKQPSQRNLSLDNIRRNVDGKLLAYRKVRLNGQEKQHVLAKVQRDDGSTVVLDLGPVDNLQARNTRLFRGMDIEAAGQPGRLNQKPILIVDRFIGDGTFHVLIPLNEREARENRQFKSQNQQARSQQFRNQRANDWRQNQNQQFNNQSRNNQRLTNQPFDNRNWSDSRWGNQRFDQRFNDQNRFQNQQRFNNQQRFQDPQRFENQQRFNNNQRFPTVTGKLVDLRSVQIEGIDDSHNLAKLQTSQGRTLIIDMGTQELDELNLQRGDRVSVSGKVGRINGKPILFADQMAEIVQIDRQDDQRFNQDQSRNRSADQQAQGY